ncbi:MAG: calcium-transporting P-type ATPase, PMR1-type [Chloroflexi bacterium]|nr:calcium-transporting P-type ATPase, PMR1-type [Chloroflexota bacterium]
MTDNHQEWHVQEAAAVIQSLDSSEQGLSEAEAESRLSQYGPNELRETRRVSSLKMLLAQLASFLIVILIIAAIVSAAIGEWVEAIAIIIIIILAAVLGFVQEYRAERALEALKNMAAPTASVIRDAMEKQIPAREVVPGDIVVLRTGDRVPADLRILEAMNLRTNESSLTGESVPVEKTATTLPTKGAPISERVNMAFMGTLVTYGRGKAIAVATGMSTEFGKIAHMLEEAETRKTPLQLSLDRTGRWIGIFALAVCAAIAAFGVARGHGAIEMLVWGAALAVAVIPEALPAVVTISLALGVRRMVRRNALIRNLPAVETLGSTSVICSDKTGTLTRNEMTVRRAWVNGRVIDIGGAGYTLEGDFSVAGKTFDPQEDIHLQTLLRVGALCNDARLTPDDGSWHIQGDPTEGALIVAAAKAKILQDQSNAEFPRLDELPFSAERKRMTTIHQGTKGKLAYSKGAPEIILDSCTRIYQNGEEKELSHRDKEKIMDIARGMAEDALRVLAMAYKPLSDTEPAVNAEQAMVFVGLVGMIDPPREEVKAAIKVCEEAGIKPVMITGDHKLTAVAVARELGLLKESIALSGAELDELSDQEFERIVEQVNVYARVSPAHKMRVIDALAKKGYVVAMTGDGVNDAPALKKADIGVAMGVTGTDVSKEAADMVLIDDNFASIVAAVEEGRSIFANIRKFLTYLLTDNLGTVIAMVAALLWGLPLPLAAAQILFINLLMDGAPAIALGVEPPEPGMMKRPPRNPRASIFNRYAIIYISCVGLWIGVAALSVFRWSAGESLTKSMTLFFATLIMLRLANAFNCRSASTSVFRIGLFSNKWLVYACASSFLLMLAAIYVPFLQVALKTAPLTLGDWIVVVGVGSTVLIAVEIAKFIASWRIFQHPTPHHQTAPAANG